ncbi:MAG: tandem-95 repeat protein [Planctomycetota bacterium]|nr:tandem-95 repeat protein [Planctomycetota bacterium]
MDGPRLLSIAPNSGEIFSTTSPNSLNESPRELVLRFDASLDPTTIQNGIRITRAGGDGAFGAASPTADVIIPPAFLNFSDPANQRVVVARFAQPLLDDLYRVEVFGVNLTSSPPATAIKDVNGLPLKTRRAGTDRDTYDFNLELGTKIVAVVPQPVTRSNTGALVQARDKVEVYFDGADRLYASDVSTGQVSPNPTVVDLSFYQLHADRGTVSNVDDVVINPTKVDYVASRNMVVLTFAQNIDQLQLNDTSFRLRIGTNEVKPSAPTTVTPATDPGSTFLTSRDLGTFASLNSLNIQEQIVNSAAFPLDFPGAPDTPGTREVDDDPAPMGPTSGNESHFLADSPDTGIGVVVQPYNFNKVNQLGVDKFGQPYFNSISPEQEQRAREIFEIYSSIAGIRFVETDSSGWTIATAPIDGVGGAIGIAGGGIARMDAAESWWDGAGPADDPTKDSWIAVATHEIGHLLGLGHSTELPPGTNMAGAYDDTVFGGEPAWLIGSPVEPVLPGVASETNLKYMFRPDSRDIDMYRFVVGAGKTGEFSAEVVAERSPNSSTLDTSISLYRENPDGTREIISTNDDYFSEDSYLKLKLAPGVYYLGVSASGNRDYNPEITDSGLGGTSEGAYSLRTSFRPLEAASITDVAGSALDGDSDGLAGGVYDFWFQAAAPNGEQTTQRRTLFVDKATGVSGGNGSRATPFLTIQAAFAAALPGDIVRLVPNGGIDGDVLTPKDNNAFEVGTGGLGNQPLRDGSTMDVPKGVTVMVDAGVLFKMGRSSIGVGSTTSSGDRSRANLQVLGTPERSVLFTSYTDESLGVDTDSLPTTPLAGDWGGVMFRNALDRAEGRNDSELQGRFVNYVGFADMRYGGGQVSIDGQNTVVTPLHMITARPTLVYNTITKSASAAMSANPDSFEETTFTTARYQAETAFTPDYSRVGPDIHGNTVTNNSVNGLFIRIETLPGQSTTGQTVSGRWDDTDIVHVMTDTLNLDGTPGGAYIEQTPPSVGGVLVASGANTIVGNLTAGTSYRYRMTFVDANGNEGVPSASTAAFVLGAGSSSIQLSNLPAATSGFVARKIYRSDNGNAFRLVADLDRSSTVLVDTAVQKAATLSAATTVARARLDASLTIDPGMVVKLQGARIVADVGSQLVAEGSETLPIVFTSRQDDRFGAGGTFDTNNDRTVSTPQPGDWGGLYFGRISTGSLDSVTVSFGGGISAIAGTFAGFNAIEVHQADVRITNSIIERNASGTGGPATANRQGAEFNTPSVIFVRGSQPIIVDNIIRNNNAPAISIDANSMTGEAVVDTGRYTGLANRNEAITENKGPLLRGNAFGGNTINGMSIRGGTLNTESIWDDTDIVHVVLSEILVPDLYVFGGLKLQSSPNESLVVKFGNGAGLTSNGRPLEIDDRIGGTLQVIGTPGFPVIATSLADDTAGAGFDPNGRAQTDTNNDGSSSVPVAGSWRSLRIDEFSNDRNVVTTTELEPAQSTGGGVNAFPSTAQYLGILAPNEKSGDDNSRLGFTISGVINNINDLDIYSFRGTAGSNIWLDIDRTNISLDSVIEIVDSNGNIIAQSDNSFEESQGLVSLYANSSAIDGRFVNAMQTSPFSPRNGGGALTNTFADFYSTNPLDPGMRVVLPGTKGTVNTYFVRVRSSNIDSRLPGVNRADLQDASKVSNGKTEGQYQLQIRLREMDEFGGSSISLADVRYATNAIEVLGMPTHSPLVGEAVELATNNNQIANALDLGNLANTDRAALSVGGDLNSLQDVDWYKFQVNQVSLQSGGLVQHLSAVIDVDYADGLGRANTSLWLFYDDQNGLGTGTTTGIRLVAFGNDSNIADDFAAPLRGSNVDDLTRGSAGVLDAFLGNIELPSGNYYLAITSNELASDYLSQLYRGDAGGNPLTRVEPVNSVTRIIEDRFGGSTNTAVGPLQTAFTGTATGATPNAVPYNLADVVLFVSQQAPGSDTSELISINALTGQQVSLVSRFPFVQDITVRGDGTIHGSRAPQTGVVQDSNSGGILAVDSAGNATTAVTAGSGIVTFEMDRTVSPPAANTAVTPATGQRNGRGMEFLGLTYPQVGGDAQFLYAVGSRAGGVTTFDAGTIQRDARNYVYKLDPTSLLAISAPQQDRAAGPPDTRLQGAGTSIVERGYIDTSRDAGGQVAPTQNAQNTTAQTIRMDNATTTTLPALLTGDKVTVRTGLDTGSPVDNTFTWVASELSATLIANTSAQRLLNPTFPPPAPTNYFSDGMSFQLDTITNSKTFEIETGRVLVNNHQQNQDIDKFSFTITNTATTPNRSMTFEFDRDATFTAGNARVIFDQANTTQLQLSTIIVDAINNPITGNNPTVPLASIGVEARLLPGTNRISLRYSSPANRDSQPGLIIGALAGANPGVANPMLVTEIVDNFPALGGGQSYDGAYFTITDRSGTSKTFEFDNDNSVLLGGPIVAIDYTAATTQQFLTQSISAAINTAFGGTVQAIFTPGSNRLKLIGDAEIVQPRDIPGRVSPISFTAQTGAVRNVGALFNNDFAAGPNYDGAQFRLDLSAAGGGPVVTYELDSNNSVIETPTLRQIVINGATTRASLNIAILNAINSTPNTTLEALVLPGTNTISIVRKDSHLAPVVSVLPLLTTPFSVNNHFVNNFPTLSGGQTYEGATFTVRSQNGTEQIFEFDNILNGVSPTTNVRVSYNSSTVTQAILSQAIATAINGVATLGVTATVSATAINVANASNLIVSATPNINPLSVATLSDTELVPIEEYYTNLDDTQVPPTASTPGAMPILVSKIDAFGMGIDASSIGTRLLLTGSSGANFTNTSTISYTQPNVVGTSLPFNFTDTALTLNTTLFNAIKAIEPLAQFVEVDRIWLPARSTFIQATTSDRGDTPSKNAVLSLPVSGLVTGLAFAGSNMYGVSDKGDLFQVGSGVFTSNSSTNNGDYIETIYNTTTNQRVQFASLVAGPRNAESSLQFSTLSAGLSKILFGIDTSGMLYAFDTLGRPAHVFPDAQWFIQTASTNPSGLAFSNLDVNLWHQSANRGTDAGHGVNIAFDGSRRSQENGGSSLYFGFDNPNDTQKQPGDWTGINNPIASFPGYDAARENTYDFPGGAKGSVVSNLIDLSNYSPGDKPTLYFNYYLKTENANDDNPGNGTYMRDAFRIFASDSTGEWQLLGTNNSQYDVTRLTGAQDELDYPFLVDPVNALNRQVSELFDAGSTFNGQTAPDTWRQARIDLSRFAGQKDLRIRFDMSTAGSFNVGVGGGLELIAVPASDIPTTTVAQRQFAVGGQTFEFDFGLMLQIPSGARLTNGDTFEVDGVTYTFSTANNTGNNVLFTANEAAETIAARIVPKLTLRGLTAAIDPATPSRVSVLNAVNPNPVLSTNLLSLGNFIADRPGVSVGTNPVLIRRDMTAIEVRDAIRVAFAQAFNAIGQKSNLNSIRVQDRSIILYKPVTNRGPLLLSGSLQGDEFGEPVSGKANTVGQGAQRGQNNRFEGVYVDDLVIGFAERGEMVTYQANSTTSVTSFSKNPRHEPAAGYAEIETGTYQVEVRRGATYGAGGAAFPTLTLASSFDTNDRSSQQLSLVAPRGSQVFDGQTFQLSNGVTIATYEYDDTSIVSGPRVGVAQGNVRVPFSSLDTAAGVGQSMRDAINSAASRSILDVTAGMSDGTVSGGTFVGKPTTSRIVNIHSTGKVAANNLGGANFGVTQFTTSTAPTGPGYILFGIDTFKLNEAGDQNRDRDQGLVMISSNIIRDVSGVGIVVDSGARISPLTPLAGALPHPGAARNLLQFNATGLVPGPVIVNNLIYSAAVGGILFSGDQRSANSVQAPVPFGRIVNNTIVGLNGAGIGINVTDNASPTLLNNIIASNAVGINVDASSSTTVIGSTLYKGNAANVGGSAVLGNKPQLLSASDPLFVNAAARNYYLASGTRAIDSSADSQNDRQEMTTVRQVLGIPDSPILAPDFDLTGQLRVDDTSVSSPDGTGANPFKDRGAYDRADFFGPVAIIQQPLDNDPDIVDVDRTNTYIRLSSGTLNSFSILLYEPEGTGPDAATVTDNSVALTENGRLLRPGVDYIFGYNASSRTIRFTPLSGFWRADSTYEVTLVNKFSYRLSMPSGSTLTDGQKITFNVGATPVVMEFDTGNGVSSGAIPVPYQTTFTPAMVAGALLKALRTSGIVGLNASAMAIDQILLSGVNSLAISPASTSLTSVAIPAITDVAQNPLQANRSSSLTQFTIVMPEVGVDYGDAMQRTASASSSGTLQSDNGARHALYPSDVPVLALGQFADADLNGTPSPAADGDDLGSAFSFSAGVPLSISNRGSTRLVVSTPVFPAVVGKTFSITDPIGKSVTFEVTNTTVWASATNYAAGVFITNGGFLYRSLVAHTSGVFATDLAAANWVLATKDTVGSNLGVNLTVGMTAQQAAAALANSIFVKAIDRGLIKGITSVQDGNAVALGGTFSHVFDLSNGVGFVQKQASGAVGIAVASDVSGLAAGQTFTIQDGSGRSVTFQFINSVIPTPLLAGNTAITLDLTAGVQTQATLAAAVLTAINDAIVAGKLRMPQATLVGSTITVNADDEDGVQFIGQFNSKTPPVTVSVTSTDTGYLDAWIDWNQDNDFDDVGEQVISTEPVIAGVNTFRVSTPTLAVSGYTTARFRLSATGGLFTTGLGIGGEVEDHMIEILRGTPPTAVDDINYQVLEDNTINISAPGILSNDSDADGDPFTVFDSNLILADGVQPLVAPRFAKSFTLNADGSFSYTPLDNFFGTLRLDGSIDYTDTFVYQVTDPRLVSSQPATVTITITPVNDRPFGTNKREPINEDNNGVAYVFSAASFGFNDPTDVPASNALLEVQILTLPPASEGVLRLGAANVTAGQAIPVALIPTLTFTPAADLNGLNRGSFTFKVRDDGGVANSGFDTSAVANTIAFDITAVNDAPSFILPTTNITLSEDPGAQNLTNFVTNVLVGPPSAADEIATQLVTFRVRALDPTRFAVQPAITPTFIGHGGNGNFTFTLAPDVNNVNSGPILVELQADDQGGPGTFPNGPLSLKRTVTINVTQVNDPPTFTISQTVFNTTEDAPRTIIPGFVSNILVGPATAVDEVANQTATPTVRAVNPLLFSSGPTLSGSGDLEFQLAPDVNSLFTDALEIVVTVKDNGTPVESASKTLTIVAAAINDAPSFVINPLKTTINVDEDNETLTNTTETVVNDFALNLRQGPVTARDEAGLESVVAQTLSYDPIIISNPSIFSQLPTIDAAGRLHFHTEANRSGSSVFVIRLRDNGLAGPPPNSNTGPTATYTINIRAVNDAPEFTIPASTTVAEDQGVATIPGFATGIRPGPATAVDESTQELTFIVTAADPSVFTVQPTIQADGTLVFQTAKDVNNNTRDSDGALLNRRIIVSLRDNGSNVSPNVNQSANQTFTLNINPVNDPPIPSVHVRPGTEDTLVSFSAASIINAASPDRPDAPGPADESAQIVRMTQIERTTDRGGVVTPVFGTGLQSDQILSFTYNPPLNYVGDDLIRYVVTDDGSPQQSATGTITIQLAPVNDPPQFIPGSDIAVQEDSVAFSAPWASAIFAGPPSAVDELNGVPPLTPAQTVSFAITTDNNALFAVLPAVSPTGVLTFTLAKDANGRAIVDVTAVDSGLGLFPDINRSAVAKLTIVANAVNDAPGFNVIGNVTVDEDSNRYTGAAIKDIVPAEGMNSTPPTGSDEVGQVISIITSNNNTSLFSVQPTVSSTGVLEFVPAQDAFGTAIVSVIARDNGANTLPNVNQSAAKTFTITLTPKNDAPIAVNDRYTTGEDTVLTVNAPGLLTNDRDVDLPNDTITVASSQSTSTLGAIVRVLPNGQFTYDSRNAAQLQRLVDGETAVDTFTYTIKDAAGVLSNLATVTVTVSGSNDNPIAVDDKFSVPFGTSQLLNVLANDRDPDTSIDPRTVEIGQLAAHGTAIAQSTGRIDYRPAAGFRGVDTFTYRVRDALGAISNEATVTVTINTPPVAVADFARTNVGTAVVIDVLRNDSDEDGTLNRSSVVIGSGPDVGSATVQTDGTIRYSPPAGFGGTATLQYSVLDNDGLASNFASVTILVGGSVHQNPVNNLDVDADGFVSPIDVLILVNDINTNGFRTLPTTLATPPYLDPNGNGGTDALDVLSVINFINERGNAGAGEGEASMAWLGYSQEIVRTPSKQEIVTELRRAEYLSSVEGQIDLAVSSVGSESVYGPSLAGEFDNEDADDSLDSYLAGWTVKPKRTAGALDSIFAEEDWV